MAFLLFLPTLLPHFTYIPFVCLPACLSVLSLFPSVPLSLSPSVPLPLCLCFVETGSLHSLVCPGIHNEDQAGLSAGNKGLHQYIQLSFVPYCRELWVLRIAQCYLLCTFCVLMSFCPPLQDSLSYAAEVGPLLHRVSLASPCTVSSPTDSWASHQLPFLCLYVAHVCSLMTFPAGFYCRGRLIVFMSLLAPCIHCICKCSLCKGGKWSQF